MSFGSLKISYVKYQFTTREPLQKMNFYKCNKNINNTIRILTVSILSFFIHISCTHNNTEYIDLPYNPQTIPSLHTDSLTMLISDSGIVRYKVIAGDQQIYDKATNPYYYFPEGVYVEQFDTSLNVVATLKADTAWNFTNQKLWKLKGKVLISNINNETFSTDEVFWDEKEQRVYSDKYIEINRPQKINLKGLGFTSNQSMTEYKIFKPHDSNIFVSSDGQ